MNTLKVTDYRKFAAFDYQSSKSSKYQLGDIMFRIPEILTDEKFEVGVIIQIHSETDFRTDMWGNCSESEDIRPAKLKQIQVLRPELFDHMELDFVLVEVRSDGYGYIVSKPGRKAAIEELKKQRTPEPGYQFEVLPVQMAADNSKLIGREYLA